MTLKIVLYNSFILSQCNLNLENEKNVQINNFEPAELTVTVNNNISDEFFIENYKTKLFKTYRYRLFNSANARIELYNHKNRLSVKQCDNFYKKMIRDNIISVVNLNFERKYKFNLQVNGSNKFLTHEYIVKSLGRSLSREISKKSSSSKLRRNLKLELRPSVDDWGNYLEDMVADRFLIKLKEG